MEGRLLPPEPGRFQSFPRLRWSEEFGLARQVPLSYIEWIYDGYGADVNPLVRDVSTVVALSAETGVALRSVCADIFMERPFVRCVAGQYQANRELLITLLERSCRVGVTRVVIPFVDNSEIATSDEMDVVVGMLEECLPVSRSTGVELHLETSLDPSRFKSLLDRVSDPMIKVNYDTGNSAALGYRPSEEFEAYGARVGSVHIKDRKYKSGTVALGTGDTDFSSVFANLKKAGYAGDFTLQVARSVAGDEVAWARASRAFVARQWSLE